MTARRAILILGMHRSGTSALARVLNLCGAALPDALLPANAANEAGYWEPIAVVQLHDELLKAAGSAWDAPGSFPRDWFESPQADLFADRLAGILETEFRAAPLFVVKDPRACRVVPLWLRVLDRLSIAPTIVLIVRHPLEVAASLAARDGLGPAHVLLSWLQHVLAAEASTRGCQRVFVTYEQLIADWSAVVGRVESATGTSLPVPHGVGTPAAQAIGGFLQPSLRHARVTAEQDRRLSGVVRAVYEWHVEAAAGRPGDTAELDRIRRGLDLADEMCGPLVRELQAAVAARDATIQSAATERERLQARFDMDREALQARRLELVGELQAAVTEREALQERQLELERELATVHQRACELHETMRAMERSPFWKARSWFRRPSVRPPGD